MNILFMLLLCSTISVHDGDTATLKCNDSKIHKVRLLGIDAPEISSPKCSPQPFSEEAQELLSSVISSKEVTLEIQGQDIYHRDLGTIYVNGLDANQQLVIHGFAEVYRGDAHYPQHPYFPHEQTARQEKTGMWSLPDYESPREYRKRCR